MKKILLGLLVIAMILTITACSQDQYEKLGDLMGNMSGNIYGIEANLKDVENATNQVDGAVAVDGNGIVTVKLEAETAGSIVSSVVAVKNSETKKDALKTSLSEPLLGKGATDDSKIQLKTQIATQAENNKITEEQKAANPERAEIATAVNEALAAVGASLSDNPTKAELATVAVLTTLSEAVKNGTEESLKEVGKAAVDALKITSEIGQVDIFANVDLTNLLKAFEKGISRDGEEDDIFKKFEPMVKDSITEIVNCITESSKFKKQRYDKFVMECKAMRASYEMIAKAYDIDVTADLLNNHPPVDNGLTIEDLGHYLISVIFSAIDTYDVNSGIDVDEDSIADKNMVVFLNGFINSEEGYNALVNFDRDKIDALIDDGAEFDDLAADTFDGIAQKMDTTNKVGIDYDNYEFSDFLDAAIKNENTEVGAKVNGVLRTIGVILVDSEYESLLGQLDVEEEYKGTLRGFLYMK